MKKILIILAVLTVSAAAIVAVNVNSRINDLLESNITALAAMETVKTKTCWYQSYDIDQANEQFIICSDQTSSSQIVSCPSSTWARKGGSDRCLP